MNSKPATQAGNIAQDVSLIASRPPVADPAGLVLARLRSLFPSLPPSDARVAEVILDSPDAVTRQSISEVAEVAGTSASTVVRCAQQLGFRGFHDLKIALARECAVLDAQPGDAKADSTPSGVLGHVLAAGMESIRDSQATVDPDAFQAAVETLDTAGRVLFAGIGTSAPLAQDAAYRFRVIGADAVAFPDVHVQHVAARQLGASDALVAISHTGSTRETLEVAAAAQTAGARTVAITSFSRSPLTDYADVVIVAGTREVSFQLEAMASRLAHLAVLDALLVAIAARNRKRTERGMALYSDVLADHRM